MKNRRLFLSSLAFIIALAVVSCRPVSASAAEISVGEQTQIYEYLDTSHDGLINIDFQLDENSDGNRSTRLKIYALQQFAFTEQTNFYDNLDFSVAPDSVTVSGGGGVALYKSHIDNGIHSVRMYNISGQGSSLSKPFIASDEFIVYWNFSNRYGSNCIFVPVSGYYGCQMSPYYSGGRVTFSCPSGYFSSSTLQVASGYDNASRWIIYPGTTPGAISDIQTNFYSLSVGNDQPCGYEGQIVVLPSASVPTSSPWDYYNNNLLPYIWNTYGHDFDEILVFPEGYEPPAQPTTVPVDYPTMPGFNYALETNGTEPASDYAYNLPELPTKEIAVPQFDFTSINPAEVMSPITSGLSGIWALITGVCTEFSLFPYVGIAVLCAIVALLMRLGK